MTSGLVYPYRWQVLHFAELQTREMSIYLSPGGRAYAFRERVPEDEAGAALESDEALLVAERVAVADWDVTLDAFERVETSQSARPSGRVDHTFTYERVGERLGAATLRMRLVVSGDRLTELVHYLEVPEAFRRRFDNMRADKIIAAISTFALFVGYILFGCPIGLIYLARRKSVQWKPALKWAGFIAGLQGLLVFNRLPLAWMDYNTAVSEATFLFERVGVALLTVVGFTALFAVSFMAAEGLTRAAFGQHVQLWKIWSRDVAATPTVAGGTIGGYLFVLVFIAYQVAMYMYAHNSLGWWSPSSALVNPDFLASIFPWFTAVAISLQAGFWEECLFRAVPLAGTVLLARRFGGNVKLWLVIGFVVQALVFGAGHANYPNEPSYARVVELILPSVGFGLIYLFWGLMPVIVAHFAFDVVLFSLPLFSATAPGIWVDRVLLVLFTLVPLFVVLVARARVGRWGEIAAEHRNAAWQFVEPSVATSADPGRREVREPALATGSMSGVLTAGAVGLIAWALFSSFTASTAPWAVSSGDVQRIASDALRARGAELPSPWRLMLHAAEGRSPAHEFVWQESGEETYSELLGTYLGTPHWEVRAARFEGDVAERAEEHLVRISPTGEVLRYAHRLPEAAAGEQLDEEAARRLATAALQQGRIDGLREISAESNQRPERRDWTFTYEDPSTSLESGAARVAVVVAGDEIADLLRFVHVPEEWERDDRQRQFVQTVIGIGAVVLIVIAFLAGGVYGAICWSRGRIEKRAAVAAFGVTLLLQTATFVLGWPATLANLPTALPLSTQLGITVAATSVGFLFLAAIVGLIVGWVHHRRGAVDARLPLPQLLLSGVAVGLAAAGARAALAVLGEAGPPAWESFAVAAWLSSTLGAATASVNGLMLPATILLLLAGAVDLLTKRWDTGRGLGIAVLVAAGVIFGLAAPGSIVGRLIGGLVLAALLTSAWLVVVRRDLAVVPVVAATLAVLDAARLAAVSAFPGATAGYAIGALLLLGVGLVWARALHGGASGDVGAAQPGDATAG